MGQESILEDKRPKIYPVTVQDTHNYQIHGGMRLEDLFEEFVMPYPEYFFRVSMKMEARVEGQLIHSVKDRSELLYVVVGDKEGIVPRETVAQAGVGVSTDYSPRWFDIIVPVEEREGGPFDRGLAWIDATSSQASSMSLGIVRNHGLSLDDLVKRTYQAEQTSYKLLLDIIDNHLVF